MILLLSEGQVSDHKGARLLIDALPPARELIADRGYNSDGFRATLEDLGIAPCIPSRKSRKHPHPHDPALYRQRHPIRTFLPSSRTGDVSRPDTIGAPISSWAPSRSPPP